ncbi:MAG: hypothetical protein QOD47_805 [Gemmatimonadaceae bacterium]|nr:hypothetical protein [Gemmatimonadaceae bacterium]
MAKNTKKVPIGDIAVGAMMNVIDFVMSTSSARA